jgi:hypothetical protein
MLVATAAFACGPKHDTTPPDGGAQVCTKDAKLCPDGSSVGRSGPDCEFAACPGEAVDLDADADADAEDADPDADPDPDSESEAESEPSEDAEQ